MQNSYQRKHKKKGQIRAIASFESDIATKYIPPHSSKLIT